MEIGSIIVLDALGMLKERAVMKFAGRLESLRRVSAEVLRSEIMDCRGRERIETSVLIAHLTEIDRRELYLELGYSSLFGYCEGELGHTESEAYLRIQVARVAARFPGILDRLADARMSLTVAATISSVLSEENSETVLERADGMSKRQAKELVVEYRPKPLVQSGVCRKPHRMPVASGDFLFDETPAVAGAPDTLSMQVETVDRRKATIEPAEADAYNFRFSADQKLKDKIERLAEVLGVADPFGSLDQVVAKAVEVALEQKDPRRRHERRTKRKLAMKAKASEIATKTAELERASIPSGPSVSGKRSRRAIPAEVRDRVLHRAQYRCEYRCEYHSPGEHGRRCAERTGLEIDHRQPYGMHGSDDESNLQVLCSHHNQWKAKQGYGHQFVQNKIAQSRKYSTSRAETLHVSDRSSSYAANPTQRPLSTGFARSHSNARGEAERDRLLVNSVQKESPRVLISP